MYRNHRGSTFHRNHPGYAGAETYVNKTGRNNIVACKVTHDDDMLYFYVEAAELLTTYTDPAWMRLFIDVDRKFDTGWEGYDYMLNRVVPEEKEAVLEHSDGGWNWNMATKVTWHKEGNKMHLAIPREALSLPKEKKIDLRFKWADNMQHEGDIIDFTLYGDAAPPGRFMYRYYEK